MGGGGPVPACAGGARGWLSLVCVVMMMCAWRDSVSSVAAARLGLGVVVQGGRGLVCGQSGPIHAPPPPLGHFQDTFDPKDFGSQSSQRMATVLVYLSGARPRGV